MAYECGLGWIDAVECDSGERRFVVLEVWLLLD